MKRRRGTLVSVGLAVALGALVALPLGPERQLSIDLWLAATAAWLAVQLGFRLTASAPMMPSMIRGVLRRRRPQQEPPVRYPRDLQTLEGALMRAVESPRLFDIQLRPRLLAVTDHFLMSIHGIDRALEPARASQILGASEWIIDPSVTDRSPTLADVDTLLDRVFEEASLD